MAKSTTSHGENLKSELHHWWPKSLSSHWCDEQGQVTLIRPDGTEISAPPKNFGADTNAHHILMGGAWNSTFEPSFGPADTEMPKLVEWILSLEANNADPLGDMKARIVPHDASSDELNRLAMCTASMTARSPVTRNVIRVGTEYHRQQFGLAKPEADPALIAMNQRNFFESHFRSMAGHGRWAVLVSDCFEFVFGDGFLHNFSSANPIYRGRCILPLTPTHTIVFDSPSSYRSPPRLVTIRLDREEVKTFNDIIQVYSCDFLFYRSQRPELAEPFVNKAQKQFKYHRTDWLDWFCGQLSQYPATGPAFGSRLAGIPASMRHYFD